MGRKDDDRAVFSVTLDGLADPAKKFNVIRAVREITLWALRMPKNWSRVRPPRPSSRGCLSERRREMKKKLEDAGGRVSIK